MREYCEAGIMLIAGEIFGAVYPDAAFPTGSSFLPDAPANPNLQVFDNCTRNAADLSACVASGRHWLGAPAIHSGSEPDASGQHHPWI